MFPFIKCMLYLLENSILDKPKVTDFQLVDQPPCFQNQLDQPTLL